MSRLLIRIAISLASAAVGLLLCALLLPDFHLQASGFLVAVAVLTIAQTVLSPFVFKMARKYASALLGGIGIISTLVALIIVALVPGGVTVTSFTTWILAALIIWLCTALGSWLLVAVILKRRASDRG